MNRVDKAYTSGMEEVFKSYGLNKTAAHKTAEAITEMKKKASMFNFSDYPSGGMSLSSILIPLLAAAGAGYVGYNAAMNGSKNKSAYDNVKNYFGNALSKVVRPRKAPSLFNFT